jgi:alkylation response protein AidB-like acyl-CoA dehydrogenase
VDLRFSAQDRAFQLDVQQFLRSELPPDLARRESQGFHLHREDVSDWQRRLYDKGWVAPNWPAEFGGTGWTPLQKYIFDIECGIANAPEYSLIAMSMVGPVVCRFGSDALRARFLEPMLRGDLWFCQGFSEPQAGSDLASVKTRATLDGDHYVIDGQKIWTTDAHMADYMICLCRTNPDVKPQAGLSMLLVPMDASGVSVRPIDTIDGQHTVNEVFLDQVRVRADNLVGAPGTGWTQAKFLLGNERTHNAYVGMLRRHLKRIAALIQRDSVLDASARREFQRKHALLEIDVDALEWSALRVVAGEEDGKLDAAASALKVRGSEYLLRAADLEMEILGPQAIPQFSPDQTGSSKVRSSRLMLHSGSRRRMYFTARSMMVRLRRPRKSNFTKPIFSTSSLSSCDTIASEPSAE